MPVAMTFGDWLKRRRRQLDLTQKELARRVSCSEGTIRKIEGNRRRPSVQLAQLLATHLDIPPQKQAAFITFARTKAHTAAMDKALDEMGDNLIELLTLPLPSVVWPQTTLKTKADTIKHNLPPQPTPFIGRSTELATLHDLLTQPDIRLITIVGPGGIGKTRLALACGMQQIIENSLFSDGVFFINLAPLEEAEQMALALADGLRLTLQGDGRSPQEQLLSYLCQKNLLLIIDNFEHVLDSVHLVSAIWQTALNVQILVTSRERLHLQAEQVFQIKGLDFPEEEFITDIEAFTAMQLFLQSARRNQFDFTLQDNDDLNAMGQICRLVEGFPLAIELAASWVDRLSLAHIAAELKQGIGLLAAKMHDMPDRHRSLQATFAHSWQRLEKNEQTVFAQLSVFRGGFTSRAAQTITGASLPTLSQLVHHSFLQYYPADERYQIHELMRQFGAEKLTQNQELAVTARHRHSDFFCFALQQWEVDLKSARQPTAVAEIEADYRNIESAWSYALAQNKLAQLLTAVNGLGEFYKLIGRFVEGIDTLQKTAARLQVDNVNTFDIASGRLNLWLPAWQVNLLLETHLPLSSFASYEELLQKGLALLEQLKLNDIDIRKEEAFLRLQFGALLLQSLPVNWQIVEENLAISLCLYQELNDLAGIADTFFWYHIYARGQGLLTEAYNYIQDNLALLRSIGEPRRLVDSLLRAGIVSRVLLAFDEAVAYFDQAYHMAQAVGDIIGMCHARTVAALHARWRGQFELALHYLYEALHLAQQVNNISLIVFVIHNIGWTQAYRGQPLQATLTQLEIALALLPDMEIVDGTVLQLLAQLHAGHYDMIPPFDDENENAYYLLAWGWVALVNGNDTEAISLAKRAGRQVDMLNPREIIAWSQSVLGVGLFGLGRVNEAKRALFQGLQTCVQLGFFLPIMQLMPAICLVLTGEADLHLREQGVRLYGLAKNLPYIGNSQLFSDLIGQPIRAVAAESSPHAVTTAQVKGEELDWWETAEKLLQELIELGWDKETG